MANEQNLIPANKRSPRERKELASKGAKACNEVKRKKADFRKCLNTLLACEVPDKKIKEQLEALGMNCTYEDAINLAIIRQSLRGDSRAFKVVCETLGVSTKTDAQLKAEDEKTKLEIEKLKLENEKLRAALQAQEAEIYEDDGFIDALNGAGADVFANEVGEIVES